MFGVHSIEYDRLTSFFYVFAGLRDGGEWMGWDELCALARDLDLPTVPVLTTQTVCTLEEWWLCVAIVSVLGVVGANTYYFSNVRYKGGYSPKLLSFT